MNTYTTYKIRPAGRHILTIGEELIQDNHAAVVELVKNAYDADSTYVNIEFKASPDRKSYSIVIEDNGHGMSRDDVIHKWMVPSTRDKDKRDTSPRGRTLQGRKGIGRYAASILGNDLLLETVNAEGEETAVRLEWKNFETAEYLDDVGVRIETQKTTKSSGTRLTMNGDQKRLVEWNQERFNKLQFELKKLKSPVSTFIGNDEFPIKLTITGFRGVEDIEKTIAPFPLVALFDYKIAGRISVDGKGTLEYSSQKVRNTVEEKFPFDFAEPTGCGELDIDIRVYDRDKDSIDALIKRGFTNEYGTYVGKLEAKQLLNEYNGIGVYRSGFRIRPLGDAEYDWLKLNARRVQNPSIRIGSEQTIGYVQIQPEQSSGLIEKSARDGLQENKAFGRLQKVTQAVIRELEVRRLELRDKAGFGRSARKVGHKLERLFSFDPLKEGIRAELTKGSVDKSTADGILQIINQQEEENNKVANEISETVAVYQGQATLGKIINVILHEGRQPLHCVKNDLPNLRYWCEAFLRTGDKDKLDELMPVADGIEENVEIFVQLFNRLDPLAAKKRTAKKSLLLEAALQHTLSLFEKAMQAHKVSAVVSASEKVKFLCWPQDLYAIFTNLVDNSMYWLSHSNTQNRRISIEILANENSLFQIDFRDTGPGIEPRFIETDIIFEPGFSTKPDGTGLGLAIAGESADRNGLELKAIESEDGAYFRLQPKTEKNE